MQTVKTPKAGKHDSKHAEEKISDDSASMGRANARIRDIQVFLDQVAEDHIGAIAYLDVGCFEGHITSAVAEYLKLDPKTTFGVDVVKQPTEATFTFKLTDGTTLDFPDATFDLLTMFMSAHHFQEPEKMFDESRRVAKKGAILVVREHDMSQPYLQLWYDLAHSLYSVVFNEEETPTEFVAKYSVGKYAYYHSREVWVALLGKAGWKLHSYAETGRHGVGDSMTAFYMELIAV